VEQLSRVTAVPVAEHELARGLSSMALPAEGLAPLGRTPTSRPGGVQPPRPHPFWRWLSVAGLVAVLAAGLVAGSRYLLTVPEPEHPGRRLTVDLVVMTRDLDQSELDVAGSLWSVCRSRMPRGVELESAAAFDPSDPTRIRLALHPAPGASDTKELVGCLQDTLVERVRADVLALRQTSD
jgi:hypothetical protein